MIIVQKVITADDLDVLSNTDLANIPIGGVLMVYVASTQDDTELTITGPGQVPVARDIPVVLRANAEIRERDDASFQIVVSQGGRYFIAINIVTAATCRILAKYASASDLVG